MLRALSIMTLLATTFLGGCQLVSVTIEQRHIVDIGDDTKDDYVRSRNTAATASDTVELNLKEGL